MRQRLVAVARWVWRRKWLAAAVFILGSGGLAYLTYHTSQPLFCGSCHEMKYEYRTWQASSHKGHSCEGCHYHPGLVGMARTKMGGLREAAVHFRKRPTESEIGPGMAHVPSTRCLACHKPETLPDEITYHLLRHTHRQHLERGAECTQCHANVVHGGKAPFKNTPSMSACLKCHDGQQAPNRCGLCHVRLGEIRPALYNPAWVTQHRENLKATGEANCTRCHGEDFCRSCHATARPHPAGWVTQHQKMDPKDRERCKRCHQVRGDRPEADFCTECHTARRAHTASWVSDHPQEFQREPDACGRCHQESFCRDCHQIFTPHEAGWLETHPQQARAKRDSCRTCHQDEFCQSCHTSGRPKSHTRDWATVHGPQAKHTSDSCRQCHPTNFCQSCHRKSPPQSHRQGPWVRTHGAASLADRASCRACHDSGYCASCHRGVSMPHPPDWLRTHRRSGVRESACRTCHAEAFCAACHRGSKPPSHTSSWARTHGKTAARSKAECLRCHGSNYCQVCHRIPMPHPKGIRASHPALAHGENGRYCSLCHSDEQCAKCHAHQPPASHRDPKWPKQHGATEGADGRCALCHKAATCDTCHGLPMPHPDDWVMGVHGQTAQGKPTACATCHQAKDCQTCHESTPPRSHEAKDFPKQHGAKPGAEPLCALCHGRDSQKERNACQTCHQGLPMPHPDGFALEHKPVASFAADGACLGCHQLDDCKMCHETAP